MKKPELTGGESPAFQAQTRIGSIAADNELLAPLNPFSHGCKACLGVLTLVCLFGSAAYVFQLRKGLAVTAMTDYFSWGIYIINFVFFIGVSMAGSLISAILRLLGVEWRHPITRMAEGITVFALLVAGVMIIADMGRPDRFLFVLRYGRLQSPILWDVLSLTTYLAGSLLFLYLPMIPDLAILRDQGERFAPWRRKLYRWLALGWTGAPEQKRLLERGITVMSIIIIPVAVSIHTVTAWLFGMTLRPGWHSTIIGPDFVMGALYSGVAGVITTMAILRRVFHLERFLKPEHFKRLGYLLLALCVAYAYFVVNEHIGASYTKEKTEAELLQAIFYGPYAVQFWTMAVVGLVVPGLLLALPRTRGLKGIVVASVLVNVGMWLKRFIIVVPTLSSPLLPVDTAPGQHLAYVPTWVEWAITAGGFAWFGLLYILFSKIFPILSIWENSHATASHSAADSPAPKPSSEPVTGSHAVTTALVCALFAAGMVFTTPTRAADAPTPKAAITIKTDVDGKKRIVVATVIATNKPVEGATVTFSVPRLFGNLLLGEDKTLDDGTAAAPFPIGLPGDAEGRFRVIAEVKAPDQFAGSRAEALLDGGLPFKPEREPFPRALWAPKAPVGLIVTILALMGVVWGTYAYVVVQLIQIKKGTQP